MDTLDTSDTEATASIESYFVAPPKEWTSMRWTLTRDDDKVRGALQGCDYIAGFEMSKKNVAHYHVMLIGKVDSRIKNNVKRYIGESTKKWSKENYKEFLPGISYTIKGGQYIVEGKTMQYYLSKAKPWVFQDPTTLLERPRCILTERNLIKEMRNFAENNEMQKQSFSDVLRALLKSSSWRLGESLRRGVDPLFVKEFEKDDWEDDYVTIALQRGERRYAPF